MKKKCAIIGMATTSRHLAPWDDDEFEIWCLNESYWGGHVGPDKTPFLKRADRWFQMHPDWDYFRPHNFNHPLHPEWLRNDPWTDAEKAKPNEKEMASWGATPLQRRNADFPIYMLEVDDLIPGSTLYPIQDIIDSYGVNSKNMKWFTNSFGYMMALAIHLGQFEEIHYYGFEMSSEEEYGNQRACAVFWAGVAIGRGIEIVEPEGCKMLGQSDVLYGYDKIPGITKMHLEIERNMYKKQTMESGTDLERIRGEKERVNRELAAALKSNQKGRINRSKQALEDLMNREIQTLITVNSMNTAQQVVEKHMRDLDGMPSPDAIKLIPLGGKIKIT